MEPFQPASQPVMSLTRDQLAPPSVETKLPHSAHPAPSRRTSMVVIVAGFPGAPGRATADKEQVAASPTTARTKPASSPSRNDDEAASQRSESASRPRRQADADAIATQRLIARDLGIATAPPASAPTAPLDRDAGETQRLIERDLGPFLHRNRSSSTQGTYPASH